MPFSISLGKSSGTGSVRPAPLLSSVPGEARIAGGQREMESATIKNSRRGGVSVASLRKYRRYVPLPLLRCTKRILLKLLDFRAWVARDRRKGLPPASIRWLAGDGDFEAIGAEFLGYLTNLCGLQPHHKVLDLGCGPGRMALALSRYLTSDGGYTGIDIVSESIDWCRANITRQFPGSTFIHADVYNRKYNPGGTLQPAEYRLPFPDGKFDLVLLTSLFTHMLPRDVDHYLQEVSRVLRATGKCLVTFFLLNAESLRLISMCKGAASFKYHYDVYAIEDPREPELAVAYDEGYIFDLFARSSLEVERSPYYGSWPGRSDYTSYQDMVVVVKRSSAR